MPDAPPDPHALAQAAGRVIAERTGVAEHDVAIVLGSGWTPALASLGSPTATLTMAELPGFTLATVQGHLGHVLSLPIRSHRVLVLAGRVHAYEGHELSQVVHPVRTACAAGARIIVLTSAAGGLRPDL
ncbi:MAG: purine-nucleoside phosphorylase, partial [Mycobacteriaceae bacterium]|nr:purine-nucleoside phosphorylase [Mycobacteriaceae bacterium]